MTSSLQDLCTNFCTVAQFPPPELLEHEDGIVSFTVMWHDIAVDLLARPSEDPDHAFIIFNMGVPDPSHADHARILEALLSSNHATLRANQPVFSCHPDTHAALLQWAVPLAGTSGDDLHRLIGHGVDLAMQWRQNHFLAPGGTDSGTVREALGSYA